MHIARGLSTCYKSRPSFSYRPIGISNLKTKPTLTPLCEPPGFYTKHHQSRFAYVNALCQAQYSPAQEYFGDNEQDQDVEPQDSMIMSNCKPTLRSKPSSSWLVVNKYEADSSLAIRNERSTSTSGFSSSSLIDEDGSGSSQTQKYELKIFKNYSFDVNELKLFLTEECAALVNIQIKPPVITPCEIEGALKETPDAEHSSDILDLIPKTSRVNCYLENFSTNLASNNEDNLGLCCNDLTSKNSKNIEDYFILYSSDALSTTQQQRDLEKPTKEQLTKIFHTLQAELPLFFVKPMSFNIYSPNIIFENRIKGTNTVGLFPYIKQASFLRLAGHVKYAYIKFEVLKITLHPEDFTVRVRWRIAGMPTIKSLLMVFTLKSFTREAAKEKLDYWYDGFSTFCVGKDGLVYKHVADKMMPDEELLIQKKPSLATRLAAMLGLAPKAPVPSETAVTSAVIDVTKQKPHMSANKACVMTLFNSDNVETIL